MSDKPKIDSDFTINKVKVLDGEFDHNNDVEQPPFFLNAPGPISLRGKTTPYKAET